MASPTQSPDANYPDPQSDAQRTPYAAYQPAIDGRREEHADESGQPGEAHPSRGVPDDPALRMQLAGMMGGFLGQPAENDERTSQQGSHAQSAGAGFHALTAGPGSTRYAAASSSKQPRSKVSRACDECRRKKIRCDAGDESGRSPCSSCRRSNLQCAFSREPLKRGPSKGYIKELAERLKTLEQQLPPPGEMQAQQYAEIQRVQQEMRDNLRAQGVELQPASDPRAGDKRTWTMAQAMEGAGSAPHGLAQQHIAPYPPPPSQQYPAQMAPPMVMHGQQPQPFWRHGGVENRQVDTAVPHDVENAATIVNFDWDEAVIDEYFRLIHQTFPLLPNNKNRLRQRLAECPASLREAFLAALDCLMRTFPTTSLPPNANYDQALKKAAELLAKYPFDSPSTHTNATNLVYLQTLLLMALESDNHGPATIRGQAGPSRAEWLGRAAGVAGQLEINVIRSSSQSILQGDHDSEERLARRVWWVLFILDRWHASSTADLLKLPENSVVLLPEDQMLLGESTYHLARLSFIIGHLAAILTTTKTPSTDVMAPSNPASSLLGLTLAGEIDRFRESVESVWGSLNLVHLSYHHSHLLIKRLNPNTEPTELVGHAVKVATVLNSPRTPVTPLNHHFGALAAMTLCELCDVTKTRTEALKGLEHLAAALGEGRGLAGKQRSEGWDGAIRELVLGKRERMLGTDANGALGTLADAAAGGNAEGQGGDNGSGNFDPTYLTRYGYLTALGQGMFRTK